MKSLIKQKTDKFSNKTTTETSAVYDAGLYPAFKIIFRHISTSRIDSIVMDIEYSHTYAVAEYLNLRFGKVVLRLNDKKNYTLIPHENYTRENKGYNRTLNTIDFVNVEESCWYDINPKLLKEIADASDVELKIYGDNKFCYFHEVGKESISLQTAAQAMYDCIYHSKEYEHDLKASVGKIDDYKRTKKIHDIFADYVLNIIGLLGLTATFVGGVWSFFTFSWEPIKKLFLISIIIFIPNLIATIYYSYKVKEYESKNKK